MTLASIKTIGVVGAGTMGQGIAQVCASAGFKVILYDIQPALISAAIDVVSKSLDASIDKGKISADRKETILNLISPVSDFSKLKVDMVIEAAVENLAVKQKIFAGLEKINHDTCIFTTNTSSISITQIAASLKFSGRFAGLHFFNPAAVMKLIEIVSGAGTSDTTIKLLVEFVQRLSKEAVLVQDSPGFIVNRVARHYYVESLKIVDDDVADFKTIDSLLKASGFKMGPFELMDMIGIDVNLAVTNSIYNGFHQDPKFRPSRIQQQKVDAGQLGRKTGKGFYDYK